ncbi:MAG: hypothetical protein JWO25_3824 [Alphaproteobacteria bacterium]|nr:hypothetical protein [Alphaproteobacteria bacterium]
MTRPFTLVVLALALAGSVGCTRAKSGPEASVPADTPGWHRVATEADRKRLREWRKAWIEALGAAKASGHQAEIAAAGTLLDPDAALPGIDLKPGDYHCRTLKLGAKGNGNLDYVAYPPASCRVGPAEGQGTMAFVRLDGPQRPIGRLFADGERRMIFLGTLQLGDEQGSLRYGHDARRDMIGLLERVGPGRWRLVFPRPAFESKLDVVELTAS